MHLTFDDGPQPGWTEAVLDALARGGAQATFFVLGERVAEAPELVECAVAEGHEIGLHGDRHLRHSEYGLDAIEADARRTLERLERLGVRPARWRAPWGVETADTRAVAQRLGLELVGWTVDPHDWLGDSADEMLARCGAEAAEPGAVVLLHDGVGPGARRSGCEATVELTELLLERARVEGAVAESLAGAAPGRPPRAPDAALARARAYAGVAA